MTASRCPLGRTPRSSSASTTPPCTRGRCVEGETCEIAGIGPVPVATVREWMGDAFLAAVLTNGDDVQKVVHLGRKFTVHAAHRPAMAEPDLCPQRLLQPARPRVRPLRRLGHTHTTRVEAAKRFCHPCHQLKSRGWHVSDPDANGECTFTPPDLKAVADAAATAVQARRRRTRTTGPAPPLPDTG